MSFRGKKVLTITAGIVLLWCFGLLLIAVLLNAAYGFPDNDADFRSEFLDSVYTQEYHYLTEYTAMQLRSDNAPDDEEAVYAFSDFLENRFDPNTTNFRFYVTDLTGNMLLTNAKEDDPAEVLSSDVYTSEIFLKKEEYSKVKHFLTPAAAFSAIRNGTLPEVLSNPDEYQLWYFTSDAIDLAYHSGVTVYTTTRIPRLEETMLFDSLDEAESFNFTELYGDDCIWEIFSSSEYNNDSSYRSVSVSLPEDDYDYEVEIMEGGIESKIPLKNGETELLTELLNSARQEAIFQMQDSGAEAAALIYIPQDSGEIHMTLEEYFTYMEYAVPMTLTDSDSAALETALKHGIDITVKGGRDYTQTCLFHIYLPDPMQVNDRIRANYEIYSLVLRHSEQVMLAMFLSLLLTVLISIPLCRAAGHSDAQDAPHIAWPHNMAYEVFWLLPIVAAVVTGGGGVMLFYNDTPYRILLIFAGGMTLFISSCCVLWLYTTAVRVKTGTFWNSFGVHRVLRRLIALFQNKVLFSIFVMADAVGLFFLNAVWLPETIHFSYIPVLITGAVDLLTLLLVLYGVYAYFELHRHVSQMERGDFEPASHSLPLRMDFGAFDRSLNNVTDSISEIVAQQMKAEHLRTELITNVSHDLKTPLTSIVNYVDLLSREPMQTEASAEYLEVLKRQAARLKKLTTDLVDASKASTGNLTVELIPTDVQVLIGQITGEFEEALEAHGLQLVQHMPQEPLAVMADGRQIWRVFENLFNNACKYALSGTRVYLDVAVEAEMVQITLKNISANPLNISPDALMERFVRGDSSRHTEGSGLGLSIARDLTALQGGTLTLETDGDLFKATVALLSVSPEMLN